MKTDRLSDIDRGSNHQKGLTISTGIHKVEGLCIEVSRDLKCDEGKSHHENEGLDTNKVRTSHKISMQTTNGPKM
jgi:hypothetical protein